MKATRREVNWLEDGIFKHRVEDLGNHPRIGLGVQEAEASDGLALPDRRGDEGDLVIEQLC